MAKVRAWLEKLGEAIAITALGLFVAALLAIPFPPWPIGLLSLSGLGWVVAFILAMITMEEKDEL